MSAREPVIKPIRTVETKVEELEQTMKRLKFITLALVAAFAIGVVAAASASAALPEMLTPGKAELTKKKFKKATSGAGKFETASGSTVECTSDTSTGEIEGTKKFTKVVVIFKGCKAGGFSCTTVGKLAGELETKELEGELGYIEKATTKVGADLKPKGEAFIEFTCAGFLKSKVTGSVIGKIEPINSEVKVGQVFKLVFKETPKGKQEFTKFEGGAEDTLMTSINGGTPEKSAEETTEEIEPEEAAEIFA